jgi:hypothetical protein
MTAAAVVVWVLVAAAVGFDLWNRRGTWRPADLSARAWTELAFRRLEARRRGVSFGWVLLAAEAVFFLIWLGWGLGRDGAEALRYLSAYGFLAVWVGLAALVLAWIGRRTARALERVAGELAALAAD